jgi:hypothetical protein
VTHSFLVVRGGDGGWEGMRGGWGGGRDCPTDEAGEGDDNDGRVDVEFESDVEGSGDGGE